MATLTSATFHFVTTTTASASATATSDPAPHREERAPIWVSIFILFGALTGLIILFLSICWVARRVMIPGISPTRTNTPDLEAHRPAPRPAAAPSQSIEVIAQKMERLDSSAPAITYKSWQVDVEGDDEDLTKAAARASSYLVCVICLETLEDSDLIRHLPCRHIYHSECITQWFLKQHDTCPLCKTNYVPQAEVEGGEAPEGANVTRPPVAIVNRDGNYDAMYRLYAQVPI
ncbi:hypothetical protein ACHAQA_003706 [Verticillium albo-atrum]